MTPLVAELGGWVVTRAWIVVQSIEACVLTALCKLGLTGVASEMKFTGTGVKYVLGEARVAITRIW